MYKMKKKIFDLTVAAVMTAACAFPCLSANAADGILYDQNASKWNYVKFDKYSQSASDMHVSGCGIFSFCNAVYALNGTITNAYDVAEWAVGIGAYRPGSGGTYRDPFYANVEEKFGQQLGFHVEGTYSGKITDERMKEHLKNGGTAVINVPWHFMAVSGYNEENDTFHILECAPNNNRKLEHDSWVDAKTMCTGRTEVYWYALLSATGTNDKSLPYEYDFNGDGLINSVDSQLISVRYQETLNGTELDEYGICDDIRLAIDSEGDINYDGVINDRDASMLLTWISEVRENGDVNCDKAIDGRDATVVLTYYALASSGVADGDITGIDEGIRAIGDMNGDGIVDARDAAAILSNYAKGAVK